MSILLLVAGLTAGLLLLGGSAKAPPSSKPEPQPVDPKAPPWNPPPPGPPLQQSEVTPEMSAFAVETLNSSTPMHGIVLEHFPEGAVYARVEWHTYQAKTGKHGLFRGVSLYWG